MLLYTSSHLSSFKKVRALRPAFAQLATVILLLSNTVYAWLPHPHMPFSSRSSFFTVLSPVMKTTGLPFSLFRLTAGSTSGFRHDCRNDNCGSLLSAIPSAADRAFIFAPNTLLWIWSI